MQGGQLSRRPLPREGRCSSSQERRKSSTARDGAGAWVPLPGRKQGRAATPEFSERTARGNYTTLLDRRTTTLKEKSCLPPLAPPAKSSLVTPPLPQQQPQPQQQLPMAASTWGAGGWMGKEQRLRVPRGRSSEPGPPSSPRNDSTSGPRHGRGPHSLMARRTFSVFSNSPERSGQASKLELPPPPPTLPASLPEAKTVTPRMSGLRQVCTPSTSWRPPRPPVEARRQETCDTPTEAGGSSGCSSRQSPAEFSDDLEPASHLRENWGRQVSVVPSEASTAHPESRGCSRCSDPGPMRRSILRSTAERSRSQQSKRVSFSVDCKPAPPSSMRDLLLSCKSGSSDILEEALAADKGATGRSKSPSPRPALGTPRGRRSSEDGPEG